MFICTIYTIWNEKGAWEPVGEINLPISPTVGLRIHNEDRDFIVEEIEYDLVTKEVSLYCARSDAHARVAQARLQRLIALGELLKYQGVFYAPITNHSVYGDGLVLTGYRAPHQRYLLVEKEELVLYYRDNYPADQHDFGLTERLRLRSLFSWEQGVDRIIACLRDLDRAAGLRNERTKAS